MNLTTGNNSNVSMPGGHGTGRAVRTGVLALLVLTSSFAGIAALAGGADSSRAPTGPDLTVSSIELSDWRPEAGTVVFVTAAVRNQGTGDALSVNVSLVDEWPGAANPSGDVVASQALVHLPQTITKNALFNWDTLNKRGLHKLWILLNSTLPSDIDISNDASFVSVVVFDSSVDLVFDSQNAPPINGEKKYCSFLSVRGNAHLVIEDAQVTFLATTHDYQCGILVEDNAQLSILRTSINTSAFAYFIFLRDQATLSIIDSRLEGVHIAAESRTKIQDVVRTQITGTVESEAQLTVFRDVNLLGRFEATGGEVEMHAVTITSDVSAVFDDTRLIWVDGWIKPETAATPTSLLVRGTTAARLTNVSMASLRAEDAAFARISRYLTIHTRDETGLILPGTQVNIFREDLENPANLVTTVTTDARGFSTIALESDNISALSNKFLGNYEIWGRVTIGLVEHQAQAALTLSNFPAMSAKDQQNREDLIFAPIPPVVPDDENLFPYGTLKVCGPSEKKASSVKPYFYFKGDIIVCKTGKWTLDDTTIYLQQAYDFQFSVIVKDTGQLLFTNGGGITSNKRLNIYVLDSGTLGSTTTGRLATFTVNAFVGGGTGAKVTLAGANINGDVRGAFDTFAMKNNRVVTGNTADVRAAIRATVAKAFTIQGADVVTPSTEESAISAAAGTAAQIIIQDSTVLAPWLSAFSKESSSGEVVLEETSASGRAPGAVPNPNATKTRLHIEASKCRFSGGTIAYDIIEMPCASVTGESAVVQGTLAFTGTQGTLRSVAAGGITVSGADAKVDRYWRLVVVVRNGFLAGLRDATVKVYSEDTGQEITPAGSPPKTNPTGRADLMLKAETIREAGTLFEGNYKVKVDWKDPADPLSACNAEFHVGLDQDHTELVSCTQVIPKPETLQLIASLNATSVDPTVGTLTVTGGLYRVYNTGGLLLPAGGGSINMTLVEMPAITQSIDVQSDGNFTAVFTFPPAEPLRHVNVTLSIQGQDPSLEQSVGPSAPQTFTVTLLAPRVTRIIYTDIILAPETGAQLTQMKAGQKITVAGRALYEGLNSPAPALPLRVAIKDTAQFAAVATDAEGRFTATLTVPRVDAKSSKFVTFNCPTPPLNAYGEPLSCSDRSPQAFTILKTKAKSTGTSPLLLAIIGAVVAVAVVAVAVLFYLRSTQVGQLVECGECGAMIPENVPVCPKCNTEFELEVVKCSKCGTWLDASQNVCSKCGAIFKKEVAGKPGVAPPPPTPPGMAPPPVPPPPPPVAPPPAR